MNSVSGVDFTSLDTAYNFDGAGKVSMVRSLGITVSSNAADYTISLGAITIANVGNSGLTAGTYTIIAPTATKMTWQKDGIDYYVFTKK